MDFDVREPHVQLVGIERGLIIPETLCGFEIAACPLQAVAEHIYVAQTLAAPLSVQQTPAYSGSTFAGSRAPIVGVN